MTKHAHPMKLANCAFVQSEVPAVDFSLVIRPRSPFRIVCDCYQFIIINHARALHRKSMTNLHHVLTTEAYSHISSMQNDDVCESILPLLIASVIPARRLCVCVL